MTHRDFHIFWDEVNLKISRVLHSFYACGKDAFINDGVEFAFWSEFEFKFPLEPVIGAIIIEIFKEEFKQ